MKKSTNESNFMSFTLSCLAIPIALGLSFIFGFIEYATKFIIGVVKVLLFTIIGVILLPFAIIYCMIISFIIILEHIKYNKEIKIKSLK